jgi:hypothetical protein
LRALIGDYLSIAPLKRLLHDAGACCRWHLAQNCWLLGDYSRSMNALADALRLTEELKHPRTTVIALWSCSRCQTAAGARPHKFELVINDNLRRRDVQRCTDDFLLNDIAGTPS